MPINFNDENELRRYISEVSDSSKEKHRHSNYEKNCIHAEDMAVHILGHLPERLLKAYRPNEPKDVHNYRLDVYEPITKGESKRIVNTLGKIQSESNYSIQYNNEGLPEDENLEVYTTENYPYLKDLKTWVFDVALKQSLIDPNSIVVFMPVEKEEFDDRFPKPFGKIYLSRQLVDYEADEYYTILLDEKSWIKRSGQTVREGMVFLVVTKNEIFKIIQVAEVGTQKVFESELLYVHNFDDPPVFFLKGDYVQETYPFCWESFISGVLPFWNKAIRMDSDLDANYVQHLYLERVEVQVECDGGCSYDEKNKNYVTVMQNGDCVTCSRCGGSGFITGRSPYGVTSVKKDNITNQQLEFPGVEYIDKPTAIVELVEKKIKDLIEKGLASINMDILNDVAANQSGIAKTIDRDDLNNFLSKISDNMFDNILKNAFKYINLWRYSMFFNNAEKLKANMPVINKPTRFDVTTVTMIAGEMKLAKDSGASNETISLMELDFIDKKFPNDKKKRKLSRAFIELDPLSGLSEAEKNDLLMTGATTRENVIISTHIKHFILDALENDVDFLDKTRAEKYQVLLQMAKDINNVGAEPA